MENEYPSIPEQGKNLGKFAFEIVKRALANGGASLIVSEEVQRERMEICKKCPNLDKKWKFCKICNCFMPLKTKLRWAECPEETPRWT